MEDEGVSLLVKMLKDMAPLLGRGALRIVIAVLIIVVGLRLIRALRKGVGRSMERSGMETTLRKFLDAVLYSGLLGLLIFVAAEELGIQSTSLVALIGSVGLATSLAMQNTLANFAGGVLILFLKPFKAGDYISTAAGEGTVESIGLVYTTLLTVENKMVVIPNNTLANSPLTNMTGVEKRRLVLNVGIGYSADLKKAKEILRQLFGEHPSILQEEGIVVIVDSFGESQVILSARGWTRTEDYWQTRWDLLEEIKLTFDREGIEIPYNYLNVRVVEDPKGDA